MNTPRVFRIVESGPGYEQWLELRDDAGAVVARHDMPGHLATLAFDCGASECRHDYSLIKAEARRACG